MKKNTSVSVLHISSGDLWAGAEVQLFTLATALKEHTNTTVTIVLFNHGQLEKKLQDKNFHVIVLDESKLNGFRILKELLAIIQDIKPDVIHTHRTKENILGSFAALLSGNTPSVRTAHGAYEPKLSWHQLAKRFIQFLNNFCANFLQKNIIAVSPELSSVLKKQFSRKKIVVIENGIDIDALQSHLNNQQKNTDASAPIKVGIAGRLAPVKRVDLFIKAACLTLKKHPQLNISFHIYGSGPLRDELEKLLGKCNNNSAIHFEGHCDNMHQALIDLDVLVISSDHEGLPMILLEAMVLNTPVIAHSIGGMPEVLDDGNCGLLIKQHDADSYANAFYALATNANVRLQLSSRAHKRVVECYSSTSKAIEYHTLYQALKQ